MSNRYEVIAPLAQGGQGEILLARRVGPAGFAKLVVLKKPKEAMRSQALVNALIEEARLLAQINHTNVCQVHDLEEANGEFFLSLEYLEGLTAWDVLSNAEESGLAIEVGALCGIIAQACDGLAAIHKLHGGVVHRDISPSNLFVTESGTIKILDLGIAKSPDSEVHTPFGNVKGKLTYLSPEQVQGRGVGARADLFALGLVLYDLAKGKRPARDRIGALTAIEVDGVPAPIAEVIRRSTATDVTARYATAAEMGAALRAAGAAVGSFYERGELAEWLAKRFARELAQKRQRIRAEEEHTAAQTAMASRVLTMKSALHAQVPGTSAAVFYTGGTERLPLPEHERLTSSAFFAAEQVTARARPQSKRKSTILFAGAAAMSIAVVVGLVIGRGLREKADPTVGGGATSAQTQPLPAQPPPPPPAQPQPSPQPAPQQPAREPQQRPPRSKPARHDRSKPSVVKPTAEGTLTVDSNPYARIEIDGKDEGTTPRFRIALPAGKHRLNATDPTGRKQQQTFVIEERKEKRLRLDWSQP